MFSDNIVYKRPGYEPIEGMEKFREVYRGNRVIREGHMKLHARNIAIAAGATGDMIENVYTIMDYPVGIATNFRINDREYLIPMSLGLKLQKILF